MTVKILKLFASLEKCPRVYDLIVFFKILESKQIAVHTEMKQKQNKIESSCSSLMTTVDSSFYPKSFMKHGWQ